MTTTADAVGSGQGRDARADAPGPDLLYSEDDAQLRASLRALLEDRSPWPEVLAWTEKGLAAGGSGDGYDARLWDGLAGVGAAGLAVSEAAGGAGASLREVAIVMEELGRSLAPTPYLGSAVLATTAVLAADPAAAVLEGLAAGERTAALAVPSDGLPGSGFGVRADGGALTGSVPGVLDAPDASVFVVPATGPGGPELHLVDAAAVRAEPVLALDLTRRLGDLTLDGAPGEPLASGDEAVAAVDAALVAGAAMLASEQLGLAERCLELTVAHLKERYQFGRPVGSFQALKHRLAELWVAVAQARATARYAADRVAAGDPDAPVAAALARAHCTPVAVRAAEECVQMHGGLGFTWEHPAHLYLKRARADALLLGPADRHRTRLAELVDLPPT